MDKILFNYINQFAGKWPLLDVLGIFFAKFFGFFLIFLLCLLFVKKPKKLWRLVLLSFVSAVIAKEVIVDTIRWFFPRHRPFVENNVNLIITREAIPSFPSGHAAFYFAIATIVYLYNKKLGILFFIGAFLISLARVFVGFHWPTDILAGAVVGIFTSFICYKIFKRITKRSLP